MDEQKQVQPQDPKAEAKRSPQEKREAERQTKGFRYKGRRLFRRMGRRAAWSDVALKERFAPVIWR